MKAKLFRINALSLFLSVMILFCSLPTFSFIVGANSATSGQCGENVFWQYDEVSQTLTINGQGKMYDYSIDFNSSPMASNAPWSIYAETISSIEIKNGICKIGDYAFACCTNLVDVFISNDVTNIGNRAFYNCQSLCKVVIPDSVLSIDSDVFWKCSSLSVVTIGANVSEINDLIFSDTDNLHLICKSEYAVNYAKKYGIDYEIDISIKYDGRCGESVFWHFDELTDALLIYGNGKMIPFLEDDYSWNELIPKIKKITIDDGVDEIYSSAFCNFPVLTNVVIANSVSKIGSYAFSSCPSLTDITLPNGLENIEKYTFASCSSLKTISIPSSVCEISEGAFEYCSELSNFKIPETVTTIDYRAFYNCSSLKSIIIPKFVKYIYYEAFAGCTDISIIEVESGNQKFHSFENCLIETQSKELLIGCKNSIIPTDGSVTSIASQAFYCCKDLKNVIIPNCVERIGSYAFFRCESITSISIPCGVTKIYSNTFSRCSSLVCVSLPDSITSIGDWAFDGCVSLKIINIPKNIVDIGSYAFSGCSNITSVTIPKGTLNIGYSAFSNCKELKNITIPNSVKNIGNYAFLKCTKLNDVYFVGNQEQWNVIDIEIGNDCLVNASRRYCLHTYDNSCDTTCNECDFQRTIIHSFVDGKCTVCGLQSLLGDVNGDNAVDAKDLTDLISILLGVSSQTGNSDLNNDGCVNLCDLVILKKLFVKQ